MDKTRKSNLLFIKVKPDKALKIDYLKSMVAEVIEYEEQLAPHI